MTAAGDLVVVDTSVLLKWFHSEGESEVAEACTILDAHADEMLVALVLELSVYELGNILISSLQWAPDDVADQLDDLAAICGPPLVPDATWNRAAAHLASQHGLTYYDASIAAAAAELGATLVSADRMLVKTGLAVTPAGFVGAR